MHKLKLSFLDIFINEFRHIVQFSPHHMGVELMYKYAVGKLEATLNISHKLNIKYKQSESYVVC